MEHAVFSDIVGTVDAVITPGNSFGLMDGGYDGLIKTYFGESVQELVQEWIKMEYAGELPIGSAFVTSMDSTIKKPEYLVYAPTMRIPMSIKNTLNVYFAFKAALLAIKERNRILEDVVCLPDSKMIKKVLCPGLGTTTGQVPFNVAAWQMRMAWYHVMRQDFEKVEMDWDFARARFLETENLRLARDVF